MEKICYDPFEAAAAGASGIILRSLLAFGAIFIGSGLGTFPESNFVSVFNIIYPFAVANLPDIAAIVACACTAATWIFLILYIRLDYGKWILFSLFSSSLYAIAFMYMAFQSAWPRDSKTQALFIPPLVALIIAIPDFVNFWLQNFRWKSLASEKHKDETSSDKKNRP